MKSNIRCLYLLALLLSALNSKISYAELDLGSMPSYEKSGAGSSDTTSVGLQNNINYNFFFHPNFFIGGKWLFDYRSESSTAASTTTYTDSTIGGKFGYRPLATGWSYEFFAMLSPTATIKSDYEYKRYGGMGWGLEAAYLMNAGIYTISPKVSYIHRTYKKDQTESNASDLAEEQFESDLAVYLSILFSI